MKSLNITVFSGLWAATFFKNFRVAAIVVRLMWDVSKNHALHTARYGVPDQHLITISSPTVLRNHWLSLQPCGHPSPARRLSLSLSLSVCVCVDAAVYCTHRLSMGKRPPEVPCWACSCGPQVAVVISRSARLKDDMQWFFWLSE